MTADTSDVAFKRVSPLSPDSQRLLAAFAREADVRQGSEGDEESGAGPASLATGLTPPNGRFVVVRVGGAAVGCGGVRVVAPAVAELKRMYIEPDRRRRGLGRLLLARLEEEARDLGCSLVRLDASPHSFEAIALYRSAGYTDALPFTDTPGVAAWLEKPLTS